MEPKNCEHGIPDGVGCMIRDTDGSVEACGSNEPWDNCYKSGGLPTPEGVWIEASNPISEITTTPTLITASTSIPLATITPRVEYLINPNPSISVPPTPGLEIAFSSDNYLALRVSNNHEVGFVLSKEAALQLADLINLELPRNEFNLAG